MAFPTNPAISDITVGKLKVSNSEDLGVEGGIIKVIFLKKRIFDSPVSKIIRGFISNAIILELSLHVHAYGAVPGHMGHLRPFFPYLIDRCGVIVKFLMLGEGRF
ncbi:hypothetical protein TNCV_2403591 [Trichonephila clavipes]|uniref:Uncharacterized protein n=1 Tax=Trichonephila clavipes TaxID=2585209 RepID=A0A8X6R0F1_TRICX|nr:hypothetical protein TNCV_2403591 [Trichonephila clavipes]